MDKAAYFGVTSDFTYCSLAFLVTDGTDLYVSTAGHCAVETGRGVGDRVSAWGVPDTFGAYAYVWCEGTATNGGCAPGTDFALIKIDADKVAYASPAMPRFGAPTGGLFTARDATPRQVEHFGWGTGPGDVGGYVGVPLGGPTQGRIGVLPTAAGTGNYVLADTLISTGDSGSAIMAMGVGENVGLSGHPQALGVITHISAGAVVQRMDVSLEKASRDLGRTFTLVTQ